MRSFYALSTLLSTAIAQQLIYDSGFEVPDRGWVVGPPTRAAGVIEPQTAGFQDIGVYRTLSINSNDLDFVRQAVSSRLARSTQYTATVSIRTATVSGARAQLRVFYPGRDYLSFVSLTTSLQANTWRTYTFTFTTPSTATGPVQFLVQGKGANANSPIFVDNAQLFATGTTTNLLTDPGFQMGTNTQQWSYFGAASSEPGGLATANGGQSRALRISTNVQDPAQQGGAVQRVEKIDATSTYVLSFFARAETMGACELVALFGSATLRLNCGASGNTIRSNAWRRFQFTLSPSAATADFFIYGSGDTPIRVDDVFFTKSNQPRSTGIPARHKRDSVAVRRHQLLLEHPRCPVYETDCPVVGLDGALKAGAYECIDPAMELSSCGGCASTGDGVDCETLPGVRNVGCSLGECLVFDCREGWELRDGKCVEEREVL